MFNDQFDYLNCGGFNNAIGDTPQPIVEIFRANVGIFPFNNWKVAVQTRGAHGLDSRDKIILNVTNSDSTGTKALLNKEHTVGKVKSDAFVIDVDWVDGMSIQGTWRLSSGCDAGYHKDDSGVCVKDVSTTCPVGQHKENGVCVNDQLSCDSGYTLSGGQCVKNMGPELPTWTIYVGLAVLAGLLGWTIYRSTRKGNHHGNG